jgi:hypothetical protein
MGFSFLLDGGILSAKCLVISVLMLLQNEEVLMLSHMHQVILLLFEV